MASETQTFAGDSREVSEEEQDLSVLQRYAFSKRPRTTMRRYCSQQEGVEKQAAGGLGLFM